MKLERQSILNGYHFHRLVLSEHLERHAIDVCVPECALDLH